MLLEDLLKALFIYILLLHVLCGIVLTYDCHRSIETVWQSDVGSSPVVSSPLLADVNGDNVRDVLLTSFNGQVSLVDGRTGHDLPGWPITLLGQNFYSAPLLYDYDNDGMWEVVLATADGRVTFVKNDGSLLAGETLQIPPLVLKKDWFQINPEHIDDKDYIVSVMQPAKSARLAEPSEFIKDLMQEEQRDENITLSNRNDNRVWSRYHRGRRPSGLSSDGEWVYVDPHVLSTPHITDFSGDGSDNELVLIVNFYFANKSPDLLLAIGLTSEEMQNYLASALIVFSLDSKQLVYSSVLEVSRKSSQYPAYVFSSSSVVLGSRAIHVVGTSAGTIHMIKSSTTESKTLSSMDSILGQVIASDVNQDGYFEMLAIDKSGNVACRDLNGNVTKNGKKLLLPGCVFFCQVWEATVSSSSAAGLRVADVDGDGLLEAVVATFDGYVWVLEGSTGQVLQGWPVRLSNDVRVSPLIIKLVPGEGKASDIIVPLMNGQIAIIRGSDQCTELISNDKAVLASPVSADLIEDRQGLELVLVTEDGRLMCLANAPNTVSYSLPADQNELFSWPSENLPCSGATFYSGKLGIRITQKSRQNTKISTKWFPLEFEIKDEQPQDIKGKNYYVRIAIGQGLVSVTRTYSSPGIYTEHVKAPPQPCRAFVTIKLKTQQSQCFYATINLSFNLHFKDDISWFLLVPLLTTGCLLLALYGWSSSLPDLLPM